MQSHGYTYCRCVFAFKIYGPVEFSLGSKPCFLRKPKAHDVGFCRNQGPPALEPHMTLVEQSQEDKAKQIFKKVDPLAYFGDWEFEVHRALWPALGVDQREYIDKEPTKAAREAAKQQGEDNLTKIAIRVLAHAVSENPVLDFHDGDVYPSKKSNGVTLQVIAQGERIEVHQIIIHSPPRRLAYHVTDTELAAWLRTGKEPVNARIGKG